MIKLLTTFALEEEYFPVHIEGYDVVNVFTGVGKAKSAMYLTKAILDEKPDCVINIGTAGTLNHSVGDVFVCRHFIDRDFYIIKLPGIEFEHDFKNELKGTALMKILEKSNLNFGTCNTGDSFVTQAESIHGNVVDMEAFAQAIVCKEFNVPFVAIKYVTDRIGENSVKHWEDKLSDAQRDLELWFNVVNKNAAKF